jgi:hypothetical protein
MLLGSASTSSAQTPVEPVVQPVVLGSPLPSGSIHGVVKNEKGEAVAGVMVMAQPSAGGTTTFAITDRDGRYELKALTPGSYVVRARLKGYLASPLRSIELGRDERVLSSFALRTAEAPVVLAAGVGGAMDQPAAEAAPAPGAEDAAVQSPDHGDHGETAWRIHHKRRSVLRKITAEDVLADGESGGQPTIFEPVDLLGRAVSSPARLATSFFADTPFSAQVNFLTASSLEHPAELFTLNNLTRGVAYVRVDAPAGAHAEWTVQGALTNADISSWIVAGSYITRMPARHRHDVGVSYSTQRYDGGNPLALRDIAEGARNVGEAYGYETFSITPGLAVTYGARYARYDYLDQQALLSPRIEVATTPADGLHVNAVWARRAHAPGAEEFLPPGENGLWLPPQRTFSSLEPGHPFQAERASYVEVEVERELQASSIAIRAFRQQVDDQLFTLFGAEVPGEPSANVGHYFVENVGDLEAAGCAAEFRTAWTDRIRTSVAYSFAHARLNPDSDLRYIVMLAPSAVRSETERIHDLSTTVEAEVPETATRVLVVYRANNAFAQPARAQNGPDSERRGFDSRFDVQVRQHLPFMSFSSAKVEMLVAVRNFFQQTEGDQFNFGELYVVRPPKRIVGGVTLHF